jgi:hypothetical protein
MIVQRETLAAFAASSWVPFLDKTCKALNCWLDKAIPRTIPICLFAVTWSSYVTGDDTNILTLPNEGIEAIPAY